MSIHKTVLAAALVACLLSRLSGSLSYAQSSEAHPLDPLMGDLTRAETRLGPQAKYVSSAMRNAFALAHRWPQLKVGLRESAVVLQTKGNVRALTSTSATAPNLSNSRIGDFTQSETSTAWCGTNAVVGFNDTGSIIESFGTVTNGGISTVGYAQSTNANASNPAFADKSFLPPVANTLLIGDPVVGCTSASNFYFSNVGVTCTGGALLCNPDQSVIDVSISTDGGATFSQSAAAVSKPFATDMLDKDWMAIDPVNHEFYVSYTDFDSSGSVCGFDFLPIMRVAIEIVSSSDGQHWGAPVEVTHVCADPLGTSAAESVQGSQIAIGPDGSVYVAWESMGLNNMPATTREIDTAKGNIGATSFAAANKVTNVACVGDCGDGILQGSIRILELPSLVAGGGSQSGKLFLSWNDSTRFSQTDLLSPTGTYNFADVKIVSSADGGSTWSAPVIVNNTSSNTDHFQPAAASDRSGRVAVCFYDRRNDTNNFYIDRYCANSTNGGVSFGANTRISTKSFLSVANQDAQLNAGGVGNYLGDYDTLASDSTNSVSGFRGGFADNISGAPNVQENKF